MFPHPLVSTTRLEFSTTASPEAWRANGTGATTSPPLERGNRTSEALPSGAQHAQATTRPRARRGQAGRYRTSPDIPKLPPAAAPIGPVPPHQHLPSTPPGCPAAFPQPQPALPERPEGRPAELRKGLSFKGPRRRTHGPH